jgi:hypothetical protein
MNFEKNMKLLKNEPDFARVKQAAPTPKVEPDLPEPSERSMSYSAPVSREVPTSNYGERRSGRITLSVEQKSMAKTLGISEADYARGLVQMRERDTEFGR